MRLGRASRSNSIYRQFATAVLRMAQKERKISPQSQAAFPKAPQLDASAKKPGLEQLEVVLAKNLVHRLAPSTIERIRFVFRVEELFIRHVGRHQIGRF